MPLFVYWKAISVIKIALIEFPNHQLDFTAKKKFAQRKLDKCESQSYNYPIKLIKFLIRDQKGDLHWKNDSKKNTTPLS